MDPLDRLYRRLVESLRREHPGTSWELTVSEIYQKLVPYRAVRGDLAFAELPEYEHALLRLLSGERDYVSLDIPDVQDEFRQELRASNPILGLYRDYAAVVVHLNPAPRLAPFAAPVEEDVTAESGPVPAAPSRPPAPVPAAAPRPSREPGSLPPSRPAAPKPSQPAASARPSLCLACRAPLPEGREVRFCPFCGATQRAFPCGGCGERVEPEWKFCAGCGLPRRPRLEP